MRTNLALVPERDPRIDAGIRLRDELLGAESKLDDAILAGSSLITCMTETRAAFDIPSTVGSNTQAKAAEAVLLVTQAKKALADAHRGLTLLQRQIVPEGLEVAAVGPIDKPGDTPPIGGGGGDGPGVNQRVATTNVGILDKPEDKPPVGDGPPRGVTQRAATTSVGPLDKPEDDIPIGGGVRPA